MLGRQVRRELQARRVPELRESRDLPEPQALQVRAGPVLRGLLVRRALREQLVPAVRAPKVQRALLAQQGRLELALRVSLGLQGPLGLRATLARLVLRERQAPRELQVPQGRERRAQPERRALAGLALRALPGRPAQQEPRVLLAPLVRRGQREAPWQ